MGSFSITCNVSRLPIQSGDPIRVLLLVENKYNDNIRCYISDIWIPRTIPIKGEYDDYGSFEKINESSILTRLIFKGLSKDILELGVGDNTCHDVRVDQNMNLDQFLEALREDRIFVKANESFIPNRKKLYESIESSYQRNIPEWIPNYKSIEGLLEDNGFQLFPKIENNSGFIVDQPRHDQNIVRIRYEGWAKELKNLQLVKDFLLSKNYNCILIPQLNDLELWIFPSLQETSEYSENKDGEPIRDKSEHRYTTFPHLEEPNKTLKIRPCVIREDVWQILLSMNQKWIKRYKKAVLKFLNKKPYIDTPEYSLYQERTMGILNCDVIGHIGIFDHLELARREMSLSEEDIQELSQNAAELYTVIRSMNDIGCMWDIYSSAGEQYSDFKNARKFYSKINSLTLKLRKQVVEEQRKNDEEFEEWKKNNGTGT